MIGKLAIDFLRKVFRALGFKRKGKIVKREKLSSSICTLLAVEFARQAESDIDMFEIIRDQASVPGCQKLHFVQMAFEKIVKAHMYKSVDERILVHTVVEKHFPIIFRTYWARTNPRTPIHPPLFHNIEQLCHKIDMLCPAKPKPYKSQFPTEYDPNCEYPWIFLNGSVQEVKSPLDYLFILAAMFRSPEFIELIKCLRDVIRQAMSSP